MTTELTLRVPPTPTLPVTTKAPVEVFVEPVDEDIVDTPLVVSILSTFVPPPFFTVNAAVSDTDIWNLLVAAIVLVAEDKEPFSILNPETDDVTEVDVCNDPPIPTPPETISAPVEVDVEAKEEEIFILPARLKVPPMPTPPNTTKPPLSDAVEGVVLVNVTGLKAVR